VSVALDGRNPNLHPGGRTLVQATLTAEMNGQTPEIELLPSVRIHLRLLCAVVFSP